MAERVSGNVRVTITFLDREELYKAVVKAGGERKTVWVRPLRGVSVNTKESYDGAARAAISFAIDEGFDADPEYDKEGTGYVLRRGPRRAGKVRA